MKKFDELDVSNTGRIDKNDLEKFFEQKNREHQDKIKGLKSTTLANMGHLEEELAEGGRLKVLNQERQTKMRRASGWVLDEASLITRASVTRVSLNDRATNSGLNA